MNLPGAHAQIFVPDGIPEPYALRRITHLGIGAHPDDLEFMALDGIWQCYDSAAQWFGGVTCTGGDEVRRLEQNEAAVIGRYGVMIQLGYPSAAAKCAKDSALKNDLRAILAATRPRVIYTHNPADKHDTHLGVLIATLEALRELPRADRPERVFGCEVWRGLDWMLDDDKVAHDVSAAASLAEKLSGVFVSQVRAKRYDLATTGRRRANATFFHPTSPDTATQVALAIDLTPLIEDSSVDVAAFTCRHIERFADDVRARLRRAHGGDPD